MFYIPLPVFVCFLHPFPPLTCKLITSCVLSSLLAGSSVFLCLFSGPRVSSCSCFVLCDFWFVLSFGFLLYLFWSLPFIACFLWFLDPGYHLIIRACFVFLHLDPFFKKKTGYLLVITRYFLPRRCEDVTVKWISLWLLVRRKNITDHLTVSSVWSNKWWFSNFWEFLFCLIFHTICTSFLFSGNSWCSCDRLAPCSHSLISCCICLLLRVDNDWIFVLVHHFCLSEPHLTSHCITTFPSAWFFLVTIPFFSCHKTEYSPLHLGVISERKMFRFFSASTLINCKKQNK